MPLAVTLTTGKIYEAFLGSADRAFYYGHSFSANPLGCAAALASLELFEAEKTLENLPTKIDQLRAGLANLKARHLLVHEVRQCGFIAGIELRQTDGSKFSVEFRIGEQVCREARNHGLLTRPILDTIVLMPPLCTGPDELDHALAALDKAISTIPR